ncbi:MAG TPA: hypothetical protein VK504_24510 [Vicinamibacterales bacterium]|jgi:hypothetical protein|nr:hypothetical protein [Vicinamibacterales bacterium]
MTVLALLALSLPCLYWSAGLDSRAALEAAAIKRVCVPPDRADSWRAAGFTVTPLTDAELASRERLPSPGITPRAGVASPTRAPWVEANGWRFTRRPAAKFIYDVPAGKAALAAAEAFASGADAVLRIDAADLGALGAMLAFLATVPAVELPAVSDFAVVDDGSAVTGEVMNLLARRNLLFQAVQAPSSRFPINIRIGSPEYPRTEAADPSAFAQKIRRQLTDDRRALRIYGSEVVLCRLTADAGRARLHLINYGGREIEGLRIRIRGRYADGEVHVAGAGRLALEDRVVADDATEFTIPHISTYAVVDLKTAR